MGPIKHPYPTRLYPPKSGFPRERPQQDGNNTKTSILVSHLCFSLGIERGIVGRFSVLNISTVGIVSVPKKAVVGNISPRAFRRPHRSEWAPSWLSSCRARKPPQGGVKYTVVQSISRLMGRGCVRSKDVRRQHFHPLTDTEGKRLPWQSKTGDTK